MSFGGVWQNSTPGFESDPRLRSYDNFRGRASGTSRVSGSALYSSVSRVSGSNVWVPAFRGTRFILRPIQGLEVEQVDPNFKRWARGAGCARFVVPACKLGGPR